MEIFSHARRPKVSVITPTLNRAKLLPDAIRSVLKQTLKDWEHIIIDDGSSDNTEDVVRKFIDHRIVYVNRFKQSGISATRNLGLRLASGKYIAFLDSDDLLTPDSLKKRVVYLDTHPAVSMIYGRMKVKKTSRYLKEVKKQKARPGVKSYDFYDALMKKTRSHQERYQLLLYADYSFLRSGTVMVRKVALDQIGGFDEKFVVSEDYDLWLRIAKKYDFHFLDQVLMTYRRTESSIMLDAGRNNTLAKFIGMAKRKQGLKT